jgi:hypothetical protein
MFIRNLRPAGQPDGIVPLQDADPANPSIGLLGIAPVAPPGARLGNLSMKYESGYGPGREGRAAGRVSTGEGDPGGVSYGAYQLASALKQPAAFLRQEGAPFAPALQGLKAAERGGAFGKVWQNLAAKDPERFFEAQHAYIQRTHYDPLVANVRKQTGLDINSQPQAVRDAVWSIAVNHSGKGARNIVTRGIQAAGAPAGDYGKALIDGLYDARENYVRQLRDQRSVPALLNRYRLERQDAHGMLNRQ